MHDWYVQDQQEVPQTMDKVWAEWLKGWRKSYAGQNSHGYLDA